MAGMGVSLRKSSKKGAPSRDEQIRQMEEGVRRAEVEARFRREVADAQAAVFAALPPDQRVAGSEAKVSMDRRQLEAIEAQANLEAARTKLAAFVSTISDTDLTTQIVAGAQDAANTLIHQGIPPAQANAAAQGAALDAIPAVVGSLEVVPAEEKKGTPWYVYVGGAAAAAAATLL